MGRRILITILALAFILSACGKQATGADSESSVEADSVSGLTVIGEKSENDLKAEDSEFADPQLIVPGDGKTDDTLKEEDAKKTETLGSDSSDDSESSVDLESPSGSDVTEASQKTTEDTKDSLVAREPKVSGKIVCIDPGHQRQGDSKKEPNGPGSGTMKARVTGGTTGRTTGVPEYQLNLDIALKLRDELVARGYTVVMTRESHDVNISNMERAQFATNQGADITVRIHANGSDNTGVSGALTMAPSASNPYVANLADSSQKLSKAVIDEYCAQTGMNNQGVVKTDTMTGINWCTMPVTIVEMGYMTNANDDTNMQNADYQNKMVTGIANGIDKYFM